jgi:hypothetical protein
MALSRRQLRAIFARMSEAKRRQRSRSSAKEKRRDRFVRGAQILEAAGTFGKVGKYIVKTMKNPKVVKTVAESGKFTAGVGASTAATYAVVGEVDKSDKSSAILHERPRRSKEKRGNT